MSETNYKLDVESCTQNLTLGSRTLKLAVKTVINLWFYFLYKPNSIPYSSQKFPKHSEVEMSDCYNVGIINMDAVMRSSRDLSDQIRLILEDIHEYYAPYRKRFFVHTQNGIFFAPVVQKLNERRWSVALCPDKTPSRLNLQGVDFDRLDTPMSYEQFCLRFDDYWAVTTRPERVKIGNRPTKYQLTTTTGVALCRGEPAREYIF